MDELRQDFRYAFRQLIRNRGFTLAAVLCIALGIGANAATFSIADALLFKTADVDDPDRLVRLYVNWSSGLQHASFSYPDYVDLRDQRSDVFAGLVATSTGPFHLSTGEGTSVVWGSIVSGNYFSELGVRLALGRGFAPEESRTPGTHAVAVLSYGLWQSRFGGVPDIVGRQITLNGHPFTVVGVADEGFRGTDKGIAAQIWAPMMMQQTLVPGANLLEARGRHWISPVIGRMKPGVSVQQAEAAANAFMTRLAAVHPDSNTGKGVEVFPEAASGLHPAVRGGFVGFISMMFAVVGFILLLACANVAGLLLARFASRYKEIGVRLALGANRWRLVRQLLTESLLLATLAGLAGLALGAGLLRLVASFRPPTDFPLDLGASMDLRVVGFAFLAAAVTCVLFGLVPALSSARLDVVSSLKEGSRGSGGHTSRLRQALVVGQVALSLVLLLGAGLAVRSLNNARQLDLGFEPDGQLVAIMDLGLQGYDETRARQFRKSLRQRVESWPGVEAVGFAEVLPLHFASQQNGAVPEGFEVADGEDSPSIDYNVVDEGYFEAMGIPMLRGRAFSKADDAEAAPVLIVNETFARKFWPGQDPIGRTVRTAGEQRRVVGLVETGKYFSIGEEPKPYMYYPFQQLFQGTAVLHVRTQPDPASYFDSLRAEVRRLDPTLPVSELKTMRSSLALAMLPARLAAGVVTAFAALALMLAAVGLYGVIAYLVSQSTREIGIRMALGAQARDVLKLVLARGASLTLLGLAGGLAGGFAMARLMTKLLYGVSAADPLPYLAATSALVLVALVATYLPARRATRLSPMLALREE
jgi:predicted permease